MKIVKLLGFLFVAVVILCVGGCSKDEPTLPGDTDVTTSFDPTFALELQKRGYVKDASDITVDDVKDIVKLDVSGKGYDSDSQEDMYGNVTSLRGIEYFKSLKVLCCDFNKLNFLDISKNTALEVLSCTRNQLSTLDIGKNIVLKELYLYNNQLSSLDVSRNKDLERLECSDNQIISLDVSKNIVLEWFCCGGNQLSKIDVSKNIVLTGMDCSGNQINTLDISNNIMLDWLTCSDNQLKMLDISKNTMLTSLQCTSNKLSSLDISKNMNLKTFYCFSNPGDGSGVFPVTAWFDNDAVPSDFSNRAWDYNGQMVTIDYRKAE